MKILYTICLLAALTCLASCDRKSPDEEAGTILQKSRQHLEEGQYDAARDSIMNLRQRYPAAIQTRAKALLLLDSVEMMAARDSMANATGEEWKRLSVKKQFFERKLQEDKKKLSL